MSEECEDDRAGMGLGITLFILILLGFLALIIGSIIVLPHIADVYDDDYFYYDDYFAAVGSSMLLGILADVCFIAAIVIASVLTCGCCCAGKYKLKHHVKKWATATLVTLCLVVILQIIATVIVYTAVGEEVSSTGTISESTANAVVASLVPISIALYILYALALVFSGLFSFGRGCGAPRASV